MSRYHGNSEACAGCGLTYGALRTGLEWSDIWIMYWTPQDAPSETWRYKRRGTILGKWHQIKREMWAEHRAGCEPARELDASCVGW